MNEYWVPDSKMQSSGKTDIVKFIVNSNHFLHSSTLKIWFVETVCESNQSRYT